MKTLSVLKKDLEFNKDLFSLLEVLKTIAVSQYRILEQKLKSFEKFQPIAESFFEFMDFDKVDHYLLNPKNDRQVVVAITSDSGFLGGLNRQVINSAINELSAVPGRLIVVGERGKTYMRETPIPFVAFPGIGDEDKLAQAFQLRNYIAEKLVEDSIGKLKVIYPKPISFTVQKVEVVSILPYKKSQNMAQGLQGEVILESSLGDLLEYLTYLLIGHKLYELFGLSKLAEFAARFVHLEESTHKLKEMDSKMKLEYFRVRHELIDRNMRELFSARLLFTSKH